MCWQCVQEAGGDTLEDTPEVRRVARMVADFYALPGCNVGGPLHIVIDDYNLEDQILDWCIENLDDWLHNWWDPGDENEDPEPVRSTAVDLVGALRTLNEAQRAAACWLAFGASDLTR